MDPRTTPPHYASQEGAEVFGPIGDYIGFLLRSVGRHPLLAVCTLAAIVALGTVAAALMPVKYEVQATTLALRTPGANREWDAPQSAARDVVIRRQNLIALCKQTNFVKRYRETRAPVVRARDWLMQKLLGAERTDEDLLDGLVNSLEQRLRVWSNPEGTVTISFAWSDPDIAYDIVEATVQSFLEARNSAEIGGMGEAIAIMQGHDATLQKEIAAAIERLEAKERALRIRSSSPLISLARPGPRPDEEGVRLEGVLEARRRALADLEGFRQRRLAELQASLTEQLTVFGPQHPTVASTRRSIESLSNPSPQVLELRTDVAQLEQRVAQRSGGGHDASAGAAASELDLAAARIRMADRRDPGLEVEQGQLETLLRRHASLVDRISAARIDLDTVQANFHERYSVITPPKRPRGPIKPYRLAIILGSILGGGALAVLASAVLDLRGGRIVERWQVEQGLDLPVLTEVRR